MKIRAKLRELESGLTDGESNRNTETFQLRLKVLKITDKIAFEKLTFKFA